MAEALAATQPVEQELITEAGDSYNLPDAEAISKYTAATCAKLVDELVKKNLLAEPAKGEEAIQGFSKMSLVVRRAALVSYVDSLSSNESKEAAEDIKAGKAVEAAALKVAEQTVGASVSVENPSNTAVDVVVEGPKEKKKPGPKPGSHKKPKVGDNQPNLKVVPQDEDPIMRMAAKIEKIKDRGELEGEIRDIVDETALDEFALGGMLAKAQSTPEWWNEHYQTFRDYVETISGVKYRKAMYCIELYVALLKMDRPWSAFDGIGWTKILKLTKILKKDTPDHTEDQMGFLDWIAKAKLLSVDALVAQIDAALKPEGEKEPEAEAEVKSMSFKLHADQREVVEAALETAMKAVNTDAKSVGLEAMAQSYMGTGLAFKGWQEAMTYARKHSDDPLTFASTVIEALEKLCPEVVFPEIMLDLRTESPQDAAAE